MRRQPGPPLVSPQRAVCEVVFILTASRAPDPMRWLRAECSWTPAVNAALVSWQIEALEALLEHERGEGRAREQRHKLTVERLRRQVADLQVTLLMGISATAI